MKCYFDQLADFLFEKLNKDEMFTCSFSAESSDFVRFNKSKIRQAGNVEQSYMYFDLIRDQKHAPCRMGLCGNFQTDADRVLKELSTLRKTLAVVPKDPHLLYATEVCSTSTISDNKLPPAKELVHDVLKEVSNEDFVAILASGSLFKGFANSFGQRNYFEKHNYNLDFSLYHEKDKAVKSLVAGFEWDKEIFRRKIERAKSELAVLKKSAKTITPGKYRVYLSPAALAEIMQMLCWGGFSEKSQQTKTSPLLKMRDDNKTLSPKLSITENIKEGASANFQEDGFVKPQQVVFLHEGSLQNCLISPRTAKEYNLITNGSNSEESPTALNIYPGSLREDSILTELHEGLYINNLWYLNYSDRQAGRITGMTRFATFWVENGKILAPVNVMRFDDSIYHFLGSNLMDLTQNREYILDSSTYDERSCHSLRLPGALIKDFALTL